MYHISETISGGFGSNVSSLDREIVKLSATEKDTIFVHYFCIKKGLILN